MRGSNFVNREGQVFGRLTVIDRAPDIRSSVGKARVAWNCKCECGNHAVVRSEHLVGNRVNSCGCIRKEKVAALKYKHGESRKGKWSLEFRAWCAAKERCYNVNMEHYENYGGRGIKMCDEWKNDFSAFLSHIGRKPRRGMSLDRIDVNGNYEPGNVRWATASEQRLNQRRMKE